MGASEDRLCVCVCFLLGSLFLTFCNVLKKLQTRWASQYLKKHRPPPEPLGESVLKKNRTSRAVGRVSTKNNRTSRAVGRVSSLGESVLKKMHPSRAVGRVSTEKIAPLQSRWTSQY